MEFQTLLIAAEVAVEKYPQGPFCPAGLMCFNYTWLAQLVNFVIFALLVNVLLVKPILGVVDEREGYILGRRNEAKANLAELQSAAAKYEAELVSTRRQAQEIVAQAQAEALKIREDQLAQVRLEAQARLDETRVLVEQERVQALTSLQNEVAVLSDQIARKLLAVR